MKILETTEVTIRIGDRNVSVTMDGEDHTCTEILEVVYGALVTHTFLPETVINSMRNFAEEHTEFLHGTVREDNEDEETEYSIKY